MYIRFHIWWWSKVTPLIVLCNANVVLEASGDVSGASDFLLTDIWHDSRTSHVMTLNPEFFPDHYLSLTCDGMHDVDLVFGFFLK